MAYNIFTPAGSKYATTPLTIPDHAIDTVLYDSSNNIGIQFVGQNTIDYGTPIAQNTLQMVSNFAGTTLPSDTIALQGQLWFNATSTSTGNLYVRLNNNTTGGIANWSQVVTGTGGVASSAAKLQTPRSITATGDATWTVTFDGSANVTSALTLATSGVTPGQYGSGSAIPVITVDGKGRITAITTAASGSVTSVSAAGTQGVSITGSPITSAGTITIGLGAITPTSVTTGEIVVGGPSFGGGGWVQIDAGPVPGTSGYVQFMSGTGGVRQGYIGFSVSNVGTIDTGTIPYVAGLHAFTGAMSASNGIGVTGNITASGAISANGAITSNGATITGTLTAGGLVSTGGFSAAANSTFAAALGVTGALTVGANLGVTGTITATSNITAYSSDARLKTNVRVIDNAINKVKSIGGYIYDWNMEICNAVSFVPSSQTEHGLIAQEVQKIMPDVVAPAPFNNDYLTIRYERIVALLVAAINEQQVQIDTLTATVAKLQK